MFEKFKLERAAKHHQAALAKWEDEAQTLIGVQYLLLHGGGPSGGGPSDIPLVLKKGERSVFELTGGGLFEPRHGPGHYQGASQGLSIPMGSSGVRFRIGQSRGTFVQGDENPTVIDTGTIVMTTQRVVFIGSKRTVEWAFSKLIAIQHDQSRPWTSIQVSNRQKVTGITYDEATEQNLRLRLEAAIALFGGETADLEAEIGREIRLHDLERPPEVNLGMAEPLSTPAPESPDLPERVASASSPTHRLPTTDPTNGTPLRSRPSRSPASSADEVPSAPAQFASSASPDTVPSPPVALMRRVIALLDGLSADLELGDNSDRPADLEKAIRALTQADDELKELSQEVVDGTSTVAEVALSPGHAAALIHAWKDAQLVIDNGHDVLRTSIDQFSRKIDRFSSLPRQGSPTSASPSPGSEPLPPPPPFSLDGEDQAPIPNAGWLPDPYYRHELRYWTGTTWTPNVADQGQQVVDPV